MERERFKNICILYATTVHTDFSMLISQLNSEYHTTLLCTCWAVTLPCLALQGNVKDWLCPNSLKAFNVWHGLVRTSC